MPGFPQRRQMLLDQSFHPILQTQAVAHRDGSVGQRRSYLQPPGPIPVMQQPHSLECKTVR
jgi:hypothetical protein